MTLRSLSAALALVVIATGPALADQLADMTARGTLRCGVLSVANPFGWTTSNYGRMLLGS